MTSEQLLAQYSAQVLAFRLNETKMEPATAPGKSIIARMTDQALHFTEAGERKHILLMGAGDGTLAENLATAAARQGLADFTVCELRPERIRQAMEAGRLMSGSFSGQILTDDSPRAAFFLLAMLGYTPANTTLVMHPGLLREESDALRRVQRLFLSAKPYKFGETLSDCGCSEEEAASPTLQTATKLTEPSLTVAAILHPEEPNLEDFVSGIPEWVSRLVIVWDSTDLPSHSLRLRIACPVSIRQIARPLANDFAEQRNRALELCQSDWILSLDADERLKPQVWENIRAFLRHNSVARAVRRDNMLVPAPDWPVCAALLPRVTLYPDRDHFRMGYGLWPDLQLRLFRRSRNLRYYRPVHELLTGFDGTVALLPHCPIEHESYILKDRDTLCQRLEVFDQAHGAPLHLLNKDFPRLPMDFLNELGACSKNLHALVIDGLA